MTLKQTIRRHLGPGLTESARGLVTFFFRRGARDHKRVLLALTQAFGEPVQLEGGAFRWTVEGRAVTLKAYLPATNNFVDIAEGK